MPRRPRTVETSSHQPAPNDPVATMMAMLLPVHAALGPHWLVDAIATAAERTMNASHAFLYLEQPDGSLRRGAAASDVRRRNEQRALDAFGPALPQSLEPTGLPGIIAALDSEAPTIADAATLLEGLATPRTLETAQASLAVDELAFVPLLSAGERLGALVLLLVGHAETEHLRLFGDHVACALVNLRQANSGTPATAAEVVRTVFDARKTEVELQRELLRAERYSREASICVIEASNLGILRDRFGTSLVEALLERVGKTLALHSRDIDAIGAYKESGYTMILSEASPEGAKLATRRLLRIAQDAAVEASVPGLELHLAAAWASCPQDGRTTDALFAAAQHRMYDPKTAVA